MKISDCRAFSSFKTLPGCRAFRRDGLHLFYNLCFDSFLLICTSFVVRSRGIVCVVYLLSCLANYEDPCKRCVLAHLDTARKILVFRYTNFPSTLFYHPCHSLFFDRDHHHMGIISGSGSFAVQFGDHLRSWDHLRTRTVPQVQSSTPIALTSATT